MLIAVKHILKSPVSVFITMRSLCEIKDKKTSRDNSSDTLSKHILKIYAINILVLQFTCAPSTCGIVCMSLYELPSFNDDGK